MHCVWTHYGEGVHAQVPSRWLGTVSAIVNLKEDINDNSRVCSKHFMYGDASNLPMLYFGRKFASPKKPEGVRAKWALKRHVTTLTESSCKRSRSQLSSGNSSRPVTPALSDSYDEDKMSEEALSVCVSSRLVTTVCTTKMWEMGLTLPCQLVLMHYKLKLNNLRQLKQAKKLSHGVLVVSPMTMNLSSSTQISYRICSNIGATKK